jgi:hypothetical protein
LRAIAGFVRKYGIPPFQDLQSVRAAANPESAATSTFVPQADVSVEGVLQQRQQARVAEARAAVQSKLEQAVSIAWNDGALTDLIIRTLRIFLPARSFDATRVRTFLVNDIRQLPRYPSDPNWEPSTRIGFAVSHLLEEYGVRSTDFGRDQRGQWKIGQAYLESEYQALLADARRQAPFKTSSADAALEHFKPWIERVVADAMARQALLPGETPECVAKFLASRIKNELQISIAGNWERTGQYDTEIGAWEVAHHAQKTLVESRDRFLVAGPKFVLAPPAPAPIAASVAVVAGGECSAGLAKLPTSVQKSGFRAWLRGLFGG